MSYQHLFEFYLTLSQLKIINNNSYINIIITERNEEFNNE